MMMNPNVFSREEVYSDPFSLAVAKPTDFYLSTSLSCDIIGAIELELLNGGIFYKRQLTFLRFGVEFG